MRNLVPAEVAEVVGSGANKPLTARRIPITCIPRLPTSEIKQRTTDFEIIQWVKERFLGAEAELDAGNGVLVTAQVPIDTVDLKQTRVRLVCRLGVPRDVAVLIND